MIVERMEAVLHEQLARAMRVLYVNHTATVSGGERSLLEPAGCAPRLG